MTAGPLVLGCVAGGAYTRTTDKAYPARPPGCTFKVFTSAPQEPYEEIGVVDHIHRGDNVGASDIREFMGVMRPYVCRSGGDAVLAFVNGMGWYVKGTVIKLGSK